MNENKTTLKEEITEKIIKVENDKIQDKIIIEEEGPSNLHQKVQNLHLLQQNLRRL